MMQYYNALIHEIAPACRQGRDSAELMSEYFLHKIEIFTRSPQINSPEFGRQQAKQMISFKLIEPYPRVIF